MDFSVERDSGAGVECAGCGITVIGTTSGVFCPDCGAEHAFCAECTPDAIEALAA